MCIYSLLSLTRPQIPPPGEREPVYSPIAGAFGGVMFGITGTFLVPGILYLQALGLKRDQMVQAMGLTFTVITVVLAVSLSSRELMPIDMMWASAGAVLPMGAGLLLGQRYRSRISEDQVPQAVFLGSCGGWRLHGGPRSCLRRAIGPSIPVSAWRERLRALHENPRWCSN